jgi:uncharacterized protein YeaO (DUF488 family)
MKVNVRRIYEDPRPDDGLRVLVDRLWPRGITKERARLDRWAKGAAPSPALRRWYGHRPERFAEFARRYREQLGQDQAGAELEALRKAANRTTLTLLTATRDVERSGAAVIAETLRRLPSRR